MTDSRHGRCFDLEFACDSTGRSFLDRQFACYPVHVCRGLHSNELVPNACTATLQSVSGGLFENDTLSGRLKAHPGAWAQVSTSASTIVHTMGAGIAQQIVSLEAEGDAHLEYLPDPLILFPDSQLKTTVLVRSGPGSVVVFSESFMAHDPKASGRSFGFIDARVEVSDPNGRLRARERLLLRGDAWFGKLTGISDRFDVYGGVWIITSGDTAALASLLRDSLASDTVYAGVSELPNQAGLQVRMLAAGAPAMRQAMRDVRALVERACLREQTVRLAQQIQTVSAARALA